MNISQTQNFLQITGKGYIKDLEERRSSKNNGNFTTCKLQAITGYKDSQPQLTFFNLIVSGDKTKEVIWQLNNAIKIEQNVLIEFSLSGIRAQGYMNQKNKVSGSLQATLDQISNIWIAGKLVFNEGKFIADVQQNFQSAQQGQYAGNNQQGYPAAPQGQYAGNNQQGYPAAPQGQYAGNNQQGYPAAPQGQYAGNSQQGYPAAPNGQYAGNSQQGYLAAPNGQYAGNNQN